MNVIVLALNGCPVGALGPYGNEWVVTPNLDRLAAEGVVFDRHVSDSPDPAAARRAWRTGRHQFPPMASEAAPGSPPAADLLAALRAKGVRTVLVRHAREANDGPPGFYADWDELFDARPVPTDSAPTDALLRVLPTVLDRLAGTDSWFLWIELDRLTPPWHMRQNVFELYVEDLLEGDDEVEPADEGGEDPERELDVENADEDELDKEELDEGEVDEEPDEEDIEEEKAAEEPILPWADPPTGWFDSDDLASWELLHRSFATTVTVFDAELDSVFTLFRDRGLDRSAAWVFTAGHGLPLGEHGLIGLHRPWLHEELVLLPLIVRLPGGAEAGRRVSAFTQPADLMPTLLAWFAAEPPVETVHGANLAPLMSGRAASVREYACSGLDLDGMTEWAIRTPDWALLVPGQVDPDDDPREAMLFQKPADRWEVNNLRVRHTDFSEALERVLREAVARALRPGPVEWPALPRAEEEPPDTASGEG